MKISVDNQEIYTLSETQKKVIKDYVHGDIFESDMRRRLHWVLNHLYQESFKKLKSQWEPKLKERGITMVPTDDEAFAELIFSQPDYKDRSSRESLEPILV